MTQTVNLIAAIGKRGQLGLDGKLPWHAAADLAFFRRMTMGAAVIVGRGTRPVLPNLPGRQVFTFGRENTPKGVLDLIAMQYKGWPVWIIGGAETYRAFAPFINGLRLISVVDYDGPADAWFPFDAFGMVPPTQARLFPANYSPAKERWQKWASEMTDEDLAAELAEVDATIAKGFGEGSGSPGEWHYERRDECDREIKRRAAKLEVSAHGQH
jgi:dihydromethanopterin reductase